MINRWEVVAVAVIAALALWAIWWLWWRLPKRQVARLTLKIRDPKARADVEDSFRRTVGQAIGGVVVLLGASGAYLQFWQQQQASRQQLQAARNQVSKGFEDLGTAGDDKLMVRLGGVYALEGVMNTSAQYHQPVLEALCAFVRNGTKGKVTDQPASDIQAALTVIGRRAGGYEKVDLSGAHLAGANLSSSALIAADLGNANLSAAILGGADLSDANMANANLGRADLNGANLTAADLQGVDLRGANLRGAKLPVSSLKSADLRGATLVGADLSGANLTNTNLGSADLSGANMRNANLSGADLTETRLSNRAQLDQACGTGAMPPTGFTFAPKRCPISASFIILPRPERPPLPAQ